MATTYGDMPSLGGPEGVQTRSLKVAPQAEGASKSKAETLDSLWTDWNKSQDPAAFNALLAKTIPVQDAAIKSYAGGDQPLVRSRAKILAANAIRSYKPTEGAQLKSWLMTQLQGLTRYRQKLSPLTAPERVQYDLSRLRKTRTALEEELGYTPSEGELRDKTGFSQKRLKHLMAYDHGVVSESQMTDNEGESYLPGTDNNSAQHLWAELVYHDLPPRDRLIYDMTFGRNGHTAGTPVKDIANALGISAAAVSQRARHIGDKLESGVDLKGNF